MPKFSNGKVDMKSELKGHLFCGGVGGPKEIEGNDKLREAYEMGENI